MTETYSIETEQAVLGSILADNRQFWRISEILTPDHFYEPLHGRIFAALAEGISKNLGVSQLTLKAQMGEDEGLEAAGGSGYFAKLAGLGGSVLDTRSHAAIIADYRGRRELLALADDLRARACGTESAADVLADITNKAFSALDMVAGTGSKTDAQVYDDILADLDKELPCYSTGLPLLDDNMAGGLYATRTYYMLGRKKSGKTMFASTISNHLRKAGVKHLFIAAEMGQKKIQQRNIASDIGRGDLAFLHNQKDPAFIAQLVRNRADYKSAVFYTSKPRIRFSEFRATVLQHIRKHQIKGFILDYIQLVRCEDRDMNQAQHLDDVAQWIAETCERENIWALCTGQLNRDGDSRGGDGPAMGGDQIYKIHRAEEGHDQAGVWLEMQDSRYTPSANIGSPDLCLMEIHKHGPSIRQRDDVRQSALI